PPYSPVIPHDIAFAGETSARKRQKIAEILSKEKLDAAVLTAPESVAWLLNIRGADVPFTPLALAFAIIGANSEVTLFMDRRKLTEDIVRHLGESVTVESPETFAAALDGMGVKGLKTRIDPDGPSSWIYERLRSAGANIVPGADPCALPKACKNQQELDGVRNAHLRDGVALVRFLAWLSRQTPGSALSELSAAKQMEAFRAEGEHYQGPSFATISAAGPNGAVVHYRVNEKNNRPLETGSLYLIDSGGQYLDGTTDVTRTVAIGEPLAEMRVNFTRALKGHIALAKARFPEGTTGSQLDVLARKALWDAGLDYNHGSGHGVGAYANVHEGPQRIAKTPNRVPLKPGMVLSNEPGYYKAGAYGLRIESLMAVTPLTAPQGGDKEMLGFETLTLAPIDIALVEKSLLSADEAVWLDAYHARVQKKLKPYVDDETFEWLELATHSIGWL
ncbi:MAG TPA: aminopeptidase P family protein, partial [Rhodospirillales bacterium]|nr:aminopeptidase P family protein [Rhodospirillales bacterium]